MSVPPMPNTSNTRPSLRRLVIAIGLSAGGLFMAGLGVGGTVNGVWTIVASPNTNTAQTNYLNDVPCTSPSQCWAVGSGFVNNVGQPLIQQWDGSSWKIVPTPS